MQTIRLLIIQYAGDYREAFVRLAAGGDETYYAQKYAVDTVAALGQQTEEVATLCCLTDQPYNQLLANGVRAIGAGFQGRIDWPTLRQLITQYHPTHLVIRSPIRPLLHWSITHQLPTLAIFADSFMTKGWRHRLRNYRLAKVLNHSQIQWVGNHGLTASQSLQNIGVNPHKIIPWDWPAMVTPDDFPAKTLARSSAQSWQVLYVGSVIADKGVGTCIDAIAQLRSQDFPVSLTIAGAGEIDFFAHQAQDLNIADAIEWVGLLPHPQVIHLMHRADLILIPSHHNYPEGLPMTIYEALSTRTPIVASDHPMFAKYLRQGRNAMIVPAADAIALAAAIKTTLSQPTLYQALSLNAAETWHNIQVPTKFADLVNRWISNAPEDIQWLMSHRLASGEYSRL